MDLVISYAVACARYAPEMDEIIRKLRKGTSKQRQADPSALKWSFSYCISIPAANLFAPPVVESFSTTEEEIQEKVNRTQVILEGRVGRWRGYAEKPIPVPPEIVAVYRKQVVEARAEKARYAALSPEEREREMQEAFAAASRYPGFVAVKRSE